HGGVEALDLLEDDLDLALPVALGAHALDDLGGDLLGGERLVDLADVVDRPAALHLVAAEGIDLLEDVALPARLEQLDGGLEGDELAELRHVDAVAVGV